MKIWTTRKSAMIIISQKDEADEHEALEDQEGFSELFRSVKGLSHKRKKEVTYKE